MIDRATIDRIMETARIEEVVGEFVTLKRAGANLKGLCPFHDEKTPSFVVSPSKGLCKCFSCGKGGNVVHFLMEHEQMTYVEALKWLANKYNIEIQERQLSDAEKKKESEREGMFIINEWARNYFQQVLDSTVDGRAIGMAYFRSRGFRDDIIRKFQLGFAPNQRNAMAQEAIRKGYQPDFLLKTGLCYQKENGELQDRYAGRVIFPVLTLSGKVVAFGGRVLQTDGKVAKYVNSPESEIYHKSRELYGIFFAKHAIQKADRCFLVEGYTDVISMHQSGVENVVASSGTSLTEGQIRMIHRFTNNITVLYDGDMAGIKASIRGIDMLLAEGMNVKVLLLPDGDDPDSFARKHNAKEYCEYIDSHQVDFIRFKTGLLLKDAGNDPLKRAQLVTSIVASIAVIPDNIMRSIYVKECSQLLNMEEKVLVEAITKMKREGLPIHDSNPNANNTSAAQQQAANTATNTPESHLADDEKGFCSPLMAEKERLLVSLIIKHGEKVICKMANKDGVEEDLTVADYIYLTLKNDHQEFIVPIHQQIMQETMEHLHDENFTCYQYFMGHPNVEISQLAVSITSSKYQLTKTNQQMLRKDEDRLLELTMKEIQNYRLAIIQQKVKNKMNELKTDEVLNNPERLETVMKEYIMLQKQENQLAREAGDRVLYSL